MKTMKNTKNKIYVYYWKLRENWYSWKYSLLIMKIEKEKCSEVEKKWKTLWKKEKLILMKIIIMKKVLKVNIEKMKSSLKMKFMSTIENEEKLISMKTFIMKRLLIMNIENEECIGDE